MAFLNRRAARPHKKTPQHRVTLRLRPGTLPSMLRTTTPRTPPFLTRATGWILT